MRIQHNIMAMNAYRNYNTNTSALSKNLEKLSSGYKINRAGDDAAGLAISEKMRAQITGLNAAQKNVKDGISLVKTAEGAMQEIQDMLNRMEYLATQSANGTYQNEVDRENLQKEVTALKTEINRIADSANFNGIKLLDGTQAGGSSGASGLTDIGSALSKEVDAIKPDKASQKGIYSVNLANFKLTATSDTKGTISIQVGGKTVATAEIEESGGSITGADFTEVSSTVTIGTTKFDVSIEGDEIVLTMKDDPTADFDDNMDVDLDLGDVTEKTSGQRDVSSALGNNSITDTVTVKQEAIFAPDRVYASASFELKSLKDGDQYQIGDSIYTFAIGKDSKYKSGSNVVNLTDKEAGADGLEILAARRLTQVAGDNKMFKVTTTNDTAVVHLTEKEGAVDYSKNDLRGKTTSALDGNWKDLVKKGNAATSGAGASGGLTLQIGETADSWNQMSVSINSMKTSSIGIDGVDISTQDGAKSAIEAIKNAINSVSSTRGDLGAIQNRLEHTQNNLSVMAENIQDAESTIRDTDVAEEMMAYTKNNILIQSAQAMLAQANAVPQGVLQLLG